MSKVYAFVLGILVGGLLTVAICLLTMPNRPRHHHHRHEAAPAAVVPVVVEIEDLTSPEQVESIMNGPQPAVIMVHSPHCGHCVAMKPNYEAAAKALKSSPVRVARIDARVAGSDFMKKYEVRGVPHIMGHKANSNGPVKYSGDRSADSLKKFMMDMA
jgi:thiol-disulfide isomerase/thioredoxin